MPCSWCDSRKCRYHCCCCWGKCEQVEKPTAIKPKIVEYENKSNTKTSTCFNTLYLTIKNKMRWSKEKKD